MGFFRRIRKAIRGVWNTIKLKNNRVIKIKIEQDAEPHVINQALRRIQDDEVINVTEIFVKNPVRRENPVKQVCSSPLLDSQPAQRYPRVSQTAGELQLEDIEFTVADEF